MSRKPKAGQFSLFDPPSETDWWADAAPDYDPDSLRYYQREAFDAVYAAWEEHRSVMIAMATGMGKTRTFGAIAKHFPGRVLVLAHREELITQAVADIEKITGERVQVEQAQLHCDSRCRVVVGSVDTVKQPHRLKRMGEDRFDLVIVDECFPGETSVSTPEGGRAIKDVRAGDLVLCVDHEHGYAGYSPVVRTMKKLYREPYVVLRIGETTLKCTGNHPIFVKGKGYVEAKDVVQGDLFCMQQAVRAEHSEPFEAAEDMRQRVQVLDCLGDYGAHEPQARQRPDEKEQPHALGGEQGEDVRHAEVDGARAEGTRGERDAALEGGAGYAGGAQEAGAGGGVGDASRGANGDGQGFWIPQPLQDRRGLPPTEDSGGGRREQSRLVGPASAGQEEGCFFTWERVGSVAREERGGAQLVYNLEVAGAHTYFAGGALVHNCHHYVGNTYTRPLEFFASAKILGVTATADRGDKRALGKTFEHVAYEMNISSGIDAGYLTPIRGRRVFIEAIDLTKVKKQGGDMHQGELDEVMLEAVEGVVRKTLELEPGRQAIAFFPGVRSSELAAERFNALKPNSAIMVSGETDKDERRLLLRDFKEGKYQYLCNCMIATEGFDAPGVSLIIMGRPTGSRSLYTQMAGRGTRVLPEAGVDSVQGSEGSAERRALIAASDKPDMVILDFCGNSGKHDLCSPEDILGGDYTEKEIALAKEKAEADGGGDPEGHLKTAREDIRRLAQTVAAAKVHASEEEFSPFSVLNVDGGDTYNIKDGFKPATDNQEDALERMGLTKQELREVSFMQAKKLLDARSVRMKNDLATYKQMLHLKKYGVDKTNVTFANARRAMDYIAKMGWGKNVSHRVVNSLAFPKTE